MGLGLGLGWGWKVHKFQVTILIHVTLPAHRKFKWFLGYGEFVDP